MGGDIWTVRRILDWIGEYLAHHGDENPRLSAQWLVSEALGMSRMQLFLEADRPLDADERAVLRDWTRRRGAGEPLQYITGTVGFRHITVKVRPGVLIPRPETEVLVSEALALLPAAPKPQDELDAELLRQYAALGMLEAEAPDSSGGPVAQGADAPHAGTLLVADICTGSGCIACSIAHEHPLTRVVATDLSPEAAALAKQNAAELDLADRIDVVECDLGTGIDPALAGSFDLVVSNPPYVPTAVLADMPREVADHEPALALDGGADGLDVFRRLLAWCDEALKPGGAFAFELHETCLDHAATETARAGFCDVRVIDDLAGKPRVLTARKPAVPAGSAEHTVPAGPTSPAELAVHAGPAGLAVHAGPAGPAGFAVPTVPADPTGPVGSAGPAGPAGHASPAELAGFTSSAESTGPAWQTGPAGSAG